MPVFDAISSYLAAYWEEILAVIIGGAILSVVGWLIQRAWRPKIKVDPTQKRPKGSGPLSFWWEIRNDGHSRSYDLGIGFRVPEANFSQLHISKLSLAHRHNVVLGYTYKEGTDPPHFVFSGAEHPYVEGQSVVVRREPDLELRWDTSYTIEIEYFYGNSDTYTRTFKLEMGPRSNPLLKLTKISVVGKAVKWGRERLG